MPQYNYQPQNSFNQIPQQQMGQPQMPPIQAQLNTAMPNTITNSIVWVETDDEAKNWMVGPNNRVFVFVGDNKTLYIKEKNSDGRPLKTEVYDLNKRQIIEENEVDLTGYVKKEDVQSMIDEAVNRALAENRRNKNYQNKRNFNRNGGMNDE